MTSPSGHVVLAGVSTRALAVSAAQAGYLVTAVDAFGDRDLRAVAKVMLARDGSGGRYSPRQAAKAASAISADLVAYTSNFENYPRLVELLRSGKRLLGNVPAALSAVRNPVRVMQALRRNGMPWLDTRSHVPTRLDAGRSWLLKPRRSGGGHGIQRWSPGLSVPRGMYLQQQMPGTAASVSFAANGSDAIVLGLSRQLVGKSEFGALPYRYCGSMTGPASALFSRGTELLDLAGRIATVLTREFQLVGLNGIDFIAHAEVPYLTEVNPRYSASMELFERAGCGSIFDLHLRSCEGILPATTSIDRAVHGKAIVFARQDVQIGRSLGWTAHPWMADLPHPGERIAMARPICTVFARAKTAARCNHLLRQRAAAVYRALGSKSRRAA